MKTSDSRISYLFNRYYQKLATEAERKELFLLIDASTAEKLTGLVSKAYSTLDEKALVSNEAKARAEVNKILKIKETPASNKKVIRLWVTMAVAASVLLIAGYSIFFTGTKEVKPTPQIAKVAPAKDALPGDNKATLTLADGTTITLDDAANGVLAKQGNIVVNKTGDGQLIYTVKASDSTANATAINKISTPRGGQYQVVLPDGSKAWLNAASSISFPTAFTQTKREVAMTGEVYFEVTKRGIPFFVSSAKGTIQVLGTHFNVMAYDDEAEMETTLLEGSVKISSSTKSNILKPGQQAQVGNNGNISIDTDADIARITAWKNGMFYFKDADVETVMRQLSRWYDVDVRYEGKISGKEINGKISRNVKASEVFGMLSYAGINCKIDGKNIIVSQ